MALMGDPELTIAATLAEGVVCIARNTNFIARNTNRNTNCIATNTNCIATNTNRNTNFNARKKINSLLEIQKEIRIA